MKKVFLRALLTAVILEIIGAAVNLVSFWSNKEFLLAQKLPGGECTEWRGFGMLLTRIIPLDNALTADTGSTTISLDVTSLLITLAAGFVLGFIVFLIAHLAKRNKQQCIAGTKSQFVPVLFCICSESCCIPGDIRTQTHSRKRLRRRLCDDCHRIFPQPFAFAQVIPIRCSLSYRYAS